MKKNNTAKPNGKLPDESKKSYGREPDLSDDLAEALAALRAFGALLSVADYGRWSMIHGSPEEDRESDIAHWGLRELAHLIADKIEAIVEEHEGTLTEPAEVQP